MFLDTMFTSTVSRRGNKCVQVYPTDFGWASVHPMTSRSEAHEALLLMFARDCVLSACMCNNANEMIQGRFHQKLENFACQLT